MAVSAPWIGRQIALVGWLAMVCAVCAPGVAMPDDLEVVESAEILEYRWHLSGFKGLVARLFIPGTGTGTLTTKSNGSGTLVTELLISSPAARDGEFWIYGAEIEPRERRTLRAWSAQKFRGKEKQKESELEDTSAVDLASSIFFLRRRPPAEVTRTQIWSSGRLYDVEVKPTGRHTELVDGRVVRTRTFSLRGVGEPRWRGQLDLTLAEDERATPLEISVAREGMRVHLELVDDSPSP